jgi:hypothetical protein
MERLNGRVCFAKAGERRAANLKRTLQPLADDHRQPTETRGPQSFVEEQRWAPGDVRRVDGPPQQCGHGDVGHLHEIRARGECHWTIAVGHAETEVGPQPASGQLDRLQRAPEHMLHDDDLPVGGDDDAIGRQSPVGNTAAGAFEHYEGRNELSQQVDSELLSKLVVQHLRQAAPFDVAGNQRKLPILESFCRVGGADGWVCQAVRLDEAPL